MMEVHGSYEKKHKNGIKESIIKYFILMMPLFG